MKEAANDVGICTGGMKAFDASPDDRAKEGVSAEEGVEPPMSNEGLEGVLVDNGELHDLIGNDLASWSLSHSGAVANPVDKIAFLLQQLR